MTNAEVARKADRYVNDKGEVAVVYSPGYGAGWSSWIDGLSPVDPTIAMLIAEGRKDEITDELMESLGFEAAYLGGLNDARIQWVAPGTVFRIHEYDGAESIEYAASDIWRA